MTEHAPKLHVFNGLPGSGKSTLAHDLAAQPGAVLVAEDAWLSALYGDQMTSLADYVTYSNRLKTVMAPHVVALLRAGVTVVLDYPANTPEQRAWLRGILDASGAPHLMHVMTADAETCWARVQARQEAGKHPFTVSRAQFDRIAAVVTRPAEAEGFVVAEHRDC